MMTSFAAPRCWIKRLNIFHLLLDFRDGRHAADGARCMAIIRRRLSAIIRWLWLAADSDDYNEAVITTELLHYFYTCIIFTANRMAE